MPNISRNKSNHTKLKIVPLERKYNSVDTGYANIVDTNSWSTKNIRKTSNFSFQGDL